MSSENNIQQVYHNEINMGKHALADIGKSVVVLCSSSIKADTQHYSMAVDTGYALALANYAVITGGGPGLMEAVNKGAQQAGGKSVGVCMKFPGVFIQNEFIDPQYNIVLTNMAARKQLFWEISTAFVALPGGYGTLDEITECITLIQMGIIKRRPVILQDAEFWKPFVSWLKDVLLTEYKVIKDDDLSYVHLASTPEETLEIIRKSI
ncbi:MAG: TIGR00730 family Rossman fold protein [Bacteroidales bacterium]|nr:TIGR00730 family Rossman fold protein [Bacteroidales bacterium]